MKRINILLVVVALLVSCSKQSLEERAKERMKPYTEIIINDPNSLIIQDVKVVLSNDSLCILHYLAKYKNAFGGYETHKMEYYMVREYEPNDDGTYDWYECGYDIENHKTLLQVAEDFERGMELHLLKSGFEYKRKDIKTTAFNRAHTANILSENYRKVGTTSSR